MFRVFERSATSFEEWVNNDKKDIKIVETRDEARKICQEFNDTRSVCQIITGTKYEFESINGGMEL